MTGNALLAARMKDAGLGQQELAEKLNERIGHFTGRLGTLADRHIRNYLTGRTRWPQARQRRALEEEFGCPVEELGFSRPPRRAPSVRPGHPEDSVRRRTFGGSAIGLVAAAALPPAPSRNVLRVGMNDANRLEHAFAQLIVSDNEHGPALDIQTRALAFAHHTKELQQVGSASQRVRARLYYLAAAFTGTAVWAAIDARQPQRAQQYLDRAMTLASLSGSEEIRLRLLGHATLLATQQGDPHDAVAAAQAGRSSSMCRRDPLFRSLASARLAAALASKPDQRGAERALEGARNALGKADPHAQRPAWIGFYDRAELDGLSALTMSKLGQHEQAEAYFHRALAQLRAEYRRNHTYYSAQLALSQVRQGDIEHACATAVSVLPSAGGDSLTGRSGRLLDQFSTALAAFAPDSRHATDWADQYANARRAQT
ncbi:XRE family transcriptional regulator [Streptomyces sp. NPDC050085]|uniref:XRE family transcriptional regulator n=1 Tax=Streptomyces sp. NPDC050085 TaxID=3365600 RepID=UPI0037A970D9